MKSYFLGIITGISIMVIFFSLLVIMAGYSGLLAEVRGCLP